LQLGLLHNKENKTTLGWSLNNREESLNIALLGLVYTQIVYLIAQFGSFERQSWSF